MVARRVPPLWLPPLVLPLIRMPNITPHFAAPPANGYTIPLQPTQKVQLALGFDQQTATAMPLYFHFTNPVMIDQSTNTPQATVSWSYSTAMAADIDPADWSQVPASNVVEPIHKAYSRMEF